MKLPPALRSPQWWSGLAVGVVSTFTVGVLIAITVPYLLPLTLGWPMLFTLTTMTLDRPVFTRGAFTSIFVVPTILVVTVGTSIITGMGFH